MAYIHKPKKIPASEYLDMIMEDHELSKEQFAKKIKISIEHLEELLSLKKDITKETAVEIDKQFSFDSGLLLRVQNTWKEGK